MAGLGLGLRRTGRRRLPVPPPAPDPDPDPPEAPELIEGNNLLGFTPTEPWVIIEAHSFNVDGQANTGITYELEPDKAYELVIEGSSDRSFSLNTCDRASRPTARTQFASTFGTHEFTTAPNRNFLYLRNGQQGVTYVDYISAREVLQ